MSSDTIFVPAHYLRHIASQLNGLGVSTDQWLAGSGVKPGMLQTSALELPLATFKQLVRDSLILAKEPDMGLLVGERLLVNAHGILGYAVINSATLRQAVDLIEHYLRLRTTLVRLHHEQDAHWFKLVVEEILPLGDVKRPVLEVITLALKNVLDYLAPRARLVQQVSLPFSLAPSSKALATSLFQCEVVLGQSQCCLFIPLTSIDQPLAMADHDGFQVAVVACQAEFDRLTEPETLAARVRRIMLEKPNGIPSLAVVARLLYLTPRTLHRRLQAEGTSYQILRDEVRHKLALNYLSAGQLSLQEIAFTLGYTDMANFRRAFKRWEGVAPSRWARR